MNRPCFLVATLPLLLIGCGNSDSPQTQETSAMQQPPVVSTRENQKPGQPQADAETSKWDEAKQDTAQAWEATKAASSSTWEATKETSAKAWEATKDTSGELWNKTRSATSEAWDATRETGAEAWDATKSGTQKVTNAIDEQLSGDSTQRD